MTDEQLTKGQALKSKIDRLKSKIQCWEKAECIAEIHLQYQFRDGYLGEKKNFADDAAYVNFGVLKTLTLQAMKTRLEELEKEYREL